MMTLRDLLNEIKLMKLATKIRSIFLITLSAKKESQMLEEWYTRSSDWYSPLVAS